MGQAIKYNNNASSIHLELCTVNLEAHKQCYMYMPFTTTDPLTFMTNTGVSTISRQRVYCFCILHVIHSIVWAINVEMLADNVLLGDIDVN